jgi:hypothetical protein
MDKIGGIVPPTCLIFRGGEEYAVIYNLRGKIGARPRRMINYQLTISQETINL